ncbi:MAG: S-layer homology domain-containing protein, partial [Candidatus Gracilibacteria bacterium]|jgi:uncharacterized protein (UPF0297 family)
MPTDKNCKNDLRDATRMENELIQLMKFASQKGADTSDISASLSKVQQVKTKLQSCDSMTQDELQANKEILMGDDGVQKKLDISRCQNEYDRLKKDQARMQKDMERSKEHLEKMKEMLSDDSMNKKIEEQLNRMEKMQEIGAKRLTLMDETGCKLWSGGDYSDKQMEWEDLNYEGQDLSDEMNNFWGEFENVQETAWASEMFNQVEKEIKKAYEKDYPSMSKEVQAKFDMIAKTMTELVAKGRLCQKENNTECVKEIKNRIDELTMKGSSLFREAPEVDFKEYGFDETVNKNFKQVSQDMGYGEANEIIKYLLSLDPTLASKITDPAMADKIFKVMGRIPENIKSTYLNDVGSLQEVFYQAVQAAPDLAKYKQDILGYNYFGDSLSNLITGLKSVRDGQITVSDLMAKLEALRSTSKKTEVEIGVTKFEDATTDRWFYDAANKEEFNIKGKNIGGKQMFDASGTTTFAEMLKVVAEGAGIKQVEGDTSYSSANNHWAKGYYKAVENSGVTLMDPNHKITRGEMAKLVIEMLKLQVESAETPFTDLSGNKYESYIATLYAKGVIKGDSTGNTVRPNDTINRAEAFTIAQRALDNLGYSTVNESQMQSYTEDFDTMNK